MDIKRTDEKLIKDIEEWNKQEKCVVGDGRTELEKQQEARINELIRQNDKLRIENELMRDLLSRPVTYTYSVR